MLQDISFAQGTITMNSSDDLPEFAVDDIYLPRMFI